MLVAVFGCMIVANSYAQNNGRQWRNVLRETNPEFFKTEQARRVGEQLMLFQRVTGGWPKNIDMVSPLSDEQREKVLADKQRIDDSTTDNGATNTQMRFLARLFMPTMIKM